jgi:hypothetical protein
MESRGCSWVERHTQGSKDSLITRFLFLKRRYVLPEAQRAMVGGGWGGLKGTLGTSWGLHI